MKKLRYETEKYANTRQATQLARLDLFVLFCNNTNEAISRNPKFNFYLQVTVSPKSLLLAWLLQNHCFDGNLAFHVQILRKTCCFAFKRRKQLESSACFILLYYLLSNSGYFTFACNGSSALQWPSVVSLCRQWMLITSYLPLIIKIYCYLAPTYLDARHIYFVVIYSGI